jgi:hypothetical protein
VLGGIVDAERPLLLARPARGNGVVVVADPAVAREPTFAPAWALLAQAYAFSPLFNADIWAGPIEEVRQVVRSSLDKAGMAAREAIRLDPRHAGGYGALAYIQTQRANWVVADDLFQQALALGRGRKTVKQGWAKRLRSFEARMYIR